MTAEKIASISDLPVADITVSHRLRPVGEAGVEAIVSSIQELGVMKDALHVRRMKDGQFVLIAGGHRLEAARRMGWETVRVEAWRCSDDWARLMEVDDNLAGAEMDALDTAVFLAERKRLYEKLHPEARAEAFRGNRFTGKVESDIVSFSTVTAEKFGVSQRHVQRLVRAGEVLDGRDVQLLRGAPRRPGVVDLMEIAKIDNSGERIEVVSALSEGRARKAAEARALYRARIHGAPAPKDPVEEAFNRLRNTFERAPKAARRRFVEAYLDALVPLVEDARARPWT